MAGDFGERIDELSEIVGQNDCTGSLTRDQVYAHYIEVGINRFSGGPLVFHRGGQALYQESSLYDFAGEYLQGIADQVLEEGPNAGMADAMERFDNHARDRCPRDVEILANSGHPTVTDDGAVVYDRAPIYPRLSEAELRAAHPGGHRYGRR